jgi:hypothetical protein
MARPTSASPEDRTWSNGQGRIEAHRMVGRAGGQPVALKHSRRGGPWTRHEVKQSIVPKSVVSRKTDIARGDPEPPAMRRRAKRSRARAHNKCIEL